MSLLLTTISNFKSKLDKRISLGLVLIERIDKKQEAFEVLNKKMNTWDDYNKEFLKQAFDDPNNEYWESYINAGYTHFGDIKSEVKGDFYLTLRGLIQDKLDDLNNLNNKAELIKSIDKTESKTKSQELSKEEVFIVHGHDEEAKAKTARFIQKLGFKPIILHEQASSGKTIIEKIESYSNVGFGIVLYTPCDVGSVKRASLELKKRARQNVVFEHGFLIGKIGRKNVCALVKGDIETPNDISGVVYITMDNGEGWEFQIAKEMKKSGYTVDMNKL